MNVAAVVLLSVAAFIYVELAIFAAVFMYLKAAGKTEARNDRKIILVYSVAAGVFFPVTFAIMAAYKVAERK